MLKKPVFSWNLGVVTSSLPASRSGSDKTIAMSERQGAQQLRILLWGKAGTQAEDPGSGDFTVICKTLWPPAPSTLPRGVRHRHVHPAAGGL